MTGSGNLDTLYLKYRPRTLDEIVGNSDLVALLRSQLSDSANGSASRSMPHALIFAGPTGCGKTTLARIVATSLGAKGSDLREIDSADFRGIDAVREIRKQSVYRPLEGSCSVWILDEVHRATGDAQSALLKLLEDTPEHVYIILCTTDPQKLLPTILGRCAQYQVKLLTEREMRQLLRRVVKAEGETLDKEVYDQIVQDSLGHPRNALQILAQALAVDGERRLVVARRTAERASQTISLCRALVKADSWKAIASILSGLKEEEPEQIRRAVLGYTQTILLQNQRNDGVARIMEQFLTPFWDSGFAGLVYACYVCVYANDA